MKLVARALLLAVLCSLLPVMPMAAGSAGVPHVRDGQHDFDWEFGAWTTELQRLRDPLSDKAEWIAYTGTSLVRPAVGARANLVELDVHGAAGTIAGLSLRLYRPDTGEWFLHFANLANGMMTSPVHGAFIDGVGTFYGDDSLRGSPVLVRFLIKPVNARQWRFEQAYSADGGKTWQDNWIALDTRVADFVPVPRAP